jgi:hypothetical protein
MEVVLSVEEETPGFGEYEEKGISSRERGIKE